MSDNSGLTLFLDGEEVGFTRGESIFQVSERHQEFIALNRDNWSQVRVFDSYLDQQPEK